MFVLIAWSLILFSPYLVQVYLPALPVCFSLSSFRTPSIQLPRRNSHQTMCPRAVALPFKMPLPADPSRVSLSHTQSFSRQVNLPDLIQPRHVDCLDSVSQGWIRWSHFGRVKMLFLLLFEMLPLLFSHYWKILFRSSTFVEVQSWKASGIAKFTLVNQELPLQELWTESRTPVDRSAGSQEVEILSPLQQPLEGSRSFEL